MKTGKENMVEVFKKVTLRAKLVPWKEENNVVAHIQQFCLHSSMYITAFFPSDTVQEQLECSQ